MADSETWTLKYVAGIFLSLIIIISLLSFSFNYFFNKKVAKENEIIDLERLALELKDLRENEELSMPIFGTNYNIFIVQTKKSENLGLSCKKDSNYCACAKKGNSILSCKEIYTKADIKTTEIKVDKNYLKLNYNEYIEIN
ncbi:MAG: hypothetical protein QXM96_00155 [Candidatus Woesearchaeota archaeon]